MTRDSRLRILFLQNSPCIRNYKYAMALKARGHRVTLAYTTKKLSERYPGLPDDVYAECVKLRDWPHLWELTARHDIVHSHNEPDTLTVAALAGDAPVIHDTHDLISLRDAHKPDLGYFEGIANRGADGRIYSTPYQQREAARLYGAGEPSLVVYNFISRDDKPQRYLPKLSASDGQIHVVYEGGFGGPPHRRFENIFTGLAELGVHVHIYPAVWKQDQADAMSRWPLVHYHRPVSPQMIMEEMTRYDYGIIPWNITEQNKRFLDSTVANKLFEYLASGLPVFASPIESYVEYFASHPVGLTFTTPQDLLSQIDAMKQRTAGVTLTDYAESYEDHIEDVERFYARVLSVGRGAPRRRAAARNDSVVAADLTSTAPPASAVPDLLYVAFMDTRFAHIMGKMVRQAAGLRAAGMHVEVHVLGRDHGDVSLDALELTFHRCETEDGQMREFSRLLDGLRPKLVYVRYQGKVMASEGFAELARKHGNFVYESQTKKPVELRLQQSLDHLRREERWGPELLKLARGLVGVTQEIVDYDVARSGRRDLPTLTMGNGIDVTSAPQRVGEPYDGGPLQVLMAASFDNWHGVDRLLRGLEAAPQAQVVLYLVGAGAIYESVRQYVSQRGLQERVRMPGWVEGEDFDRLANRCHVAVGSLALHRIELRQASVLKVRNYICRGLPILIGYEDVDLPDGLPFVWRIPSDDSAIDMNALREFALRAWRTPDLSGQMRRFAEQRLDWSVKTRELAGFLKSLLERLQARPAPEMPATVTSNPKAPRILFVCHDFPPHRYAGAQLYARNLAQKLNSTGLAKVDVLYAVWRDESRHDYVIREGEFEGLHVFELGKARVSEPQKLYDERVEAEVTRFLQEHSYDAIHVHGLGQITLAPVYAAKKLGLPVYATLHDYWLLCDRWHMIRRDQSQCSGPESAGKCAQCYIQDNELQHVSKVHEMARNYQKLRRSMMRQLFDSYDRVFAPSRYLAARFAEFGFAGIEVSPLGFEYGEIETARPDDGLFHFGYTGQLISRKGVNFLVEAFLRLPHPNARLAIHGPTESEYAKGVRKLAESDTRISFHGPYDPAQLDAIYRGFDMAVVPSLMENYPLVVQEAFQRCTPVIATEVGGIPEVVRDDVNSLLVKPESADALLQAMTRVLDAPECVERFTAAIAPVRRLKEDARHYASVYTGQKQPSSETPAKLRVQFYVAKNVHWPMFKSLYEYLSRRDDVGEIVVCLPDIAQIATSITNRATLDELLALPVALTCNPRAVPVDVTFIADAIAGKVKSAGKVVNIGHGTISKGYYFTDGVWTERQNWVDLLCTPGDYARDALSGALRTRVVATGMPKLDDVFAGRVDTAALRRQLGIVEGRKVVLYAPTFNIDLSSLYDFIDRFPELAAADCDIVIKLHGSTPGGYAARYEQLATQIPNFHFAAHSDLSPWLALADVMISDVSSAWMEFMALDKPVILYDNPRAAEYHGFDASNIEWAWRDLGTRVGGFDELKRVLPDILRNGDGKSEIRRGYAARLFADLSGHACENVWNATLETVRAEGSNQPPTISVIVRCSDDNLAFRRDQIFNAQLYSVMPLELFVIDESRSRAVGEWVDTLRRFGAFVRVEKAASEQAATQAATGEILLFLSEDTRLYKNYDYLLYRAFRQNSGVAMLTTVTDDPARGADIPSSIDRSRYDDPARFAFEFVYDYKNGEVAPCRAADPSVLAVWRDRLPEADRNDIIATARTAAARGELPAALSVYTSLFDGQIVAIVKRYIAHAAQMPPTETLELGLELLDACPLTDITVHTLEASVKLNRRDLWGRLLSSMMFIRFDDIELRKRIETLFAHQPEIATMFRNDRMVLERLAPREQAAIPAPKPQARPPRVLFYFFKNVHIPILAPIVRELKRQRPDAEIAFAIMPRRPEIRAGFEPHEEQMIRSMGETVVDDPQAWKPDVTFIADSIYGIVKGCGKIVHVGHGVLSKGQYYTDTAIARREQQADLVCTPGAWHAEKLRGILTTRIAATGMAKLDDAFRGVLTRQGVLERYGLPDDKRYLLYAPTFNDELSSLELVGDRLGELLPPDTLAIVKLHGSTAVKWKQLYRDLVQREPRIIFADDDELDITPFLVLADVLVSDVSSAMMEAAALDTPVVLYDNPRWSEYANFNPGDIDFQWRDIGECVTKLDGMKQAVARALAQPQLHREARMRRGDQLFANRSDGRASERIIAAAMSLIEN